MRKKRPNSNFISYVTLFIYSPQQNLRLLWGLLNQSYTHSCSEPWIAPESKTLKLTHSELGLQDYNKLWKPLTTKTTECTSSLCKQDNLAHSCTDEQVKQMLSSTTSSAKPLTLDRFPFSTGTKTTGQITQEKAYPEWGIMSPWYTSTPFNRFIKGGEDNRVKMSFPWVSSLPLGKKTQPRHNTTWTHFPQPTTEWLIQRIQQHTGIIFSNLRLPLHACSPPKMRAAGRVSLCMCVQKRLNPQIDAVSTWVAERGVMF